MTKKRTSRLSIASIIVILAIIAAAVWAAFYILNDREEQKTGSPINAILDVMEENAGNVEPQPEPMPEISLKPEIQYEVINEGDTAGAILQRWLSQSEVNEVVDLCRNVYSLANIRSGQTYCVYEDAEGCLTRFEYEINDDKKLVICREDESFRAWLELIEYDTMLIKLDGVINSNLFNAMSDLGENATLAVILSDVFAWEINFIKDLRIGDSFSLLIEKRYREGEFKTYGRLLAAKFINQGREFEAFYFEDSPTDGQYFTASGESVKRAFLKAPLSFTRISSGFSNSRLHPILKVYRPHPGIDYAAPKGTPVKAVGRGSVTYAGWGEGAGNYVALNHGNGYETTYMHLSGFAKGIKKGTSVKQGDIIGYVGSTGYATGPHLDFRMKKNGKLINPLQALSPRDTPVNKKNIDSFRKQISIYRDYMNGKRELPGEPAGEQPRAAANVRSD